MAVFHRDWLTEIGAIHKEIERLLDHYAGAKPPMIQFAKRAWEPAVDVYETEEALVVVIDLAGIDKNHLHVSADTSTLTVRGERANPGAGTRRSYYQMEIASGPFERVVPLPIIADARKASVSYKRGMLEIAIPKSRRKSTRRTFVTIIHSQEPSDDI